MQDGIIAGNGNSRYLKTVSAALGLYPTYEDFMTALIAGTFPIDLNGINTAGWTQQGTALNKANLLTDATCSELGIAITSTPNDALSKIKSLIDNANTNANARAKIKTGTYIGTGADSSNVNIGVSAKLVIVGNIENAFPSGNFGIASVFFGWNYQNNDPLISISGNSLIVYNSKYNSSGYVDFNSSGKTYGYAAVY